MALENCHFDYEVSSIALLDAVEPFSLTLSWFFRTCWSHLVNLWHCGNLGDLPLI